MAFLMVISPSCKNKDTTPYLDIIGGLIGTQVGIYGSNFDPSSSNNEVYFGNTQAKVISASPNILVTIVPSIPLGTYNVSVVTGQRTLAVGTFQVLFPISPSGLWGYYPLDGSAVDLGPQDFFGTPSGNLQYSTDYYDRVDRSAEFDGLDDVITTAATPDLEVRTISFMIYPTDVENPNTQVILSMDDNALDFGMVRAEITNGVLKLWAGGTLTPYADASIQNNTWYHIVLARDANNVAYYINANQVSFGPASTEGSTTDPNNNLILGAGRTTTSEFFQGKIDEVMIFNRILSDSEIFALELY